MTHGMAAFPWHFAPLLAFIGILAEIAFRSESRKVWTCLARTAAACIVLELSFPFLWQVAHLRRTNLDRVAAVVAAKAGPDDFVLVTSFFEAQCFQYYYRGKADWNTLPLASTTPESLMNLCASVQRRMETPDAIVPTLRKIETTLAGGHRLWIVGQLPLLPPDEALPELPPSPQSPFGWSCTPYLRVWSAAVGRTIQVHSDSMKDVPVPLDQAVNELEFEPLTVVVGWREAVQP